MSKFFVEGHWKRVAGLEAQSDGQFAAVWLAHDKDRDTVHVYDACVFKQEVMAVVAEGFNARGRWIPIGYPTKHKEIAEKLKERGCSLVYQPCDMTDLTTEITARDIQERMRSGRFKVDKRLKIWQDEFNTYFREGAQVPDSHPVMAATLHAMACLKWAKSNAKRRQNTINYPRMAII